jgi:hypothetical protein
VIRTIVELYRARTGWRLVLEEAREIADADNALEQAHARSTGDSVPPSADDDAPPLELTAHP